MVTHTSQDRSELRPGDVNTAGKKNIRNGKHGSANDSSTANTSAGAVAVSSARTRVSSDRFSTENRAAPLSAPRSKRQSQVRQSLPVHHVDPTHTDCANANADTTHVANGFHGSANNSDTRAENSKTKVASTVSGLTADPTSGENSGVPIKSTDALGNNNNSSSSSNNSNNTSDHVSSRTSALSLEDTEALRSRVSEITSFRVYARVRPFIAEELAEMGTQERRSIVEMVGHKTILLDPSDNWSPKAQFIFDGSLWSIPPSHALVHTFQDTKRQSYATQRDVYNTLARHLVPHVFDGYNSCILSYGQTGSGKTYTMMGRYNPHACCGGDGDEGIIPRVSNDLFLLLAERQAAAPDVRFRVEVSFVEIYKEKVRDLLDPALRHIRATGHLGSNANDKQLHDARIREDPLSGPFVEGVTKYEVENWSQCCLLLERGSMHRTTCATAVHNQSSRSHAIFQLTVLQETVIPGRDRYSRATVRTKAGRINLVDLAGSERGGFQNYVKESSAINTSLLALRRVIDNLTERQNILMDQVRAEIMHNNFVSHVNHTNNNKDGNAASALNGLLSPAFAPLHGAPLCERPLPQVPFRDSILTWLLSDSIGGNARTTMVATLSPLVKNYADTLATLQWSSKARHLVTFVKMNHEAVSQDGMQSQLSSLGGTVQQQRGNLDNLRQALREKQEMAEKLSQATVVLQRTQTKLQKSVSQLREQQAVLVLQRLCRLCHSRKYVANQSMLMKECQTAQAMRKQQVEQLQRSLAAANHAELEASRKLARTTAQANVASERVRVAREVEQPMLQSQLEEELRKKAEVFELLGAVALCEAAVQARKQERNEVQMSKDRTAEELHRRSEMRQEMESAMRRRGTEGQRQAIAEAERELPQCKAECAAQRAREQEVKMQYNAVRMRHNKLVRKSSGMCGC